MRPPARLSLGIVALLALGVGPPQARAQGYIYPARPAYVAPTTYSYAPRPQVAAAPAATYYVRPRTYYVQPRTYYVQPQTYSTAPQRRGLLRVRKYSDSSAYPYVLVDPNNPHWTFDYNEWMAHNF